MVLVSGSDFLRPGKTRLSHGLNSGSLQHAASSQQACRFWYDFNLTRFLLKHWLTERISLYAAGYIAPSSICVGKLNAGLVKHLPLASDCNRR